MYLPLDLNDGGRRCLTNTKIKNSINGHKISIAFLNYKNANVQLFVLHAKKMLMAVQDNMKGTLLMGSNMYITGVMPDNTKGRFNATQYKWQA